MLTRQKQKTINDNEKLSTELSNNSGFVIIPHFLDTTEIFNILKNVKSDDGFNPIFESIDECGNTCGGTNLRLQKPFTNEKIEKKISHLLDSSYKCDSGHLLCAKAGCPKQSWHRDFSTDLLQKLNKDNTMVYGALIALDERPFSLVPRTSDTPILLQLSPGDLLLFGGDIVHRGENVKNQSFAIHFYCVDDVQTNLCTNDYDQTEFVDFTP